MLTIKLYYALYFSKNNLRIELQCFTETAVSRYAKKFLLVWFF